MATLNGNTGEGSGGGINNPFGSIVMINGTINGNSSTSGGEISGSFFDGRVDLSNTIVANSVSGDDCSEGITTLAHNLDSDDTCSLTDPDNLPWYRSDACPSAGQRWPHRDLRSFGRQSRN